MQRSPHVSVLFEKQKNLKKDLTNATKCGIIIKSIGYAPLAQLVEQLTLNQWVLGSSPRWCTKLARWSSG